jgi:chromosome segregation ATPase
MKRSTDKKTDAGFRFVTGSKDLPATQGMLQLVRTELKSEMKAGFRGIDAKLDEMNSKFSTMDAKFSDIGARFNGVEGRFNAIDAKFSRVDARFNHMDSKFEQVLSEVSRIGLLVEEQNSKNQIVLEGLTSLWQRQERIENRTDAVEKFVRSLGRSKTP